MITTEFTRLPTALTCLNGLHYMLNFNTSLVFYKRPANVYPADARKQCYHVTNFDMVEFNMYGKLANLTRQRGWQFSELRSN